MHVQIENVDSCIILTAFPPLIRQPNSEESYAALLHAYAVAKQHGQARKLLESIQSGELGIHPGPSSYDAYTLACVQSRSWSDLLGAYETMKETEIAPSPTACHGILLATFKIGGKSAARALLEEFLSSGVQLNQASALLAIKIMVPEASCGDSVSNNEGGSFTLSSVRENLRNISEQPDFHSNLQPASLNLIRSLRRCEIEEERRAAGGLAQHTVQDGRRKAWHTVLQHLLDYVKQAEETKNQQF